MPLEAGLLEILACPACHSPLEERDTELVCTATYSDSKPMIEGVMMRLLVTVWKATVATA